MSRTALLLAGIILLCCSPPAHAAQDRPAVVRVYVQSADQPVEGAEVIAGAVVSRTDASGRVEIRASPGSIVLSVVKPGFVAASTSVEVAPGAIQDVLVELHPEPTVEEEVTVVASTRTERRLDDQPLRVEVLAREEIEEKMLMTPGDIVMMLNEMGGMRVQATSPALGAASVRIQGMRGRFTRVLSDGLPLFGEVGGLGLLQIPPMDLGRVEVIKGVASALYGAGAMSGVVNLLSRRPRDVPEREILLNRSTRGATDTVAFLSSPLSNGWSASLLAGGHWQSATDVDDDGWADLPGYARGIARPRVFWDGQDGRTFFATAGLTHEDRDGGTIDGHSLPGTGLPYVESLRTTRVDAGVVGQAPVAGRYMVSARAAVVHQRHGHRFGEAQERDRHDTAFGELAVRGSAGRQTWVGGLALERDAYTPRDLPEYGYTFTVPGVFVQHDVDLGAGIALSSSGRLDVHSEYGTFFNPRVAALARTGRWTGRLSIGTGLFGPTPITEETEAAGLSRLTVVRPLRAERGLGVSLDLSRSDGPLSYTVTVFRSRISDPIHVERSPQYVLTNLDEPTTNSGLELLGTLRREPFSVTATYTYVRARETVDEIELDVPLTPRHSAGVVGMWEAEETGRIGVEWYYTGRQRLEDNPYRRESDPYVIVGVLVERRFGRLRVFVNGENLTGVRQTEWDPLLRPARAADGRWTVDGWAPIEGRTINGGVRLSF